AGLNKRLGRYCLEKLEPHPNKPYRFARFNKEGKPYRSPIIPFYWGYKMQPGDLDKDDKQKGKYPGIYHKADNAWGGGPFQNGTNSLLQFWQDGFKRRLVAEIVDLQALNPEIDRQLQDAPPRAYYIHAAKRLAKLIDTIREDFPSEPLNVVAHSQGCLISMCAMLYVKNRAPDTLMLNSAPYAFDTKKTDSLSASAINAGVQTKEARLKTFRAIADKIAQAKTEYKQDAEKNAACDTEDGQGRTVMYAHHEPERTDWHGLIGKGKVNAQGQKWHENELTSRDNRGKVFVNFNPHDRVIGVAAIKGIGWCGIPKDLLGEEVNLLGKDKNVYQRVFARNSGSGRVPAVGQESDYWFSFFYEKTIRENVRTGAGDDGILTTSDGNAVQTVNPFLMTFDGKPAYEFWKPPLSKALGMIDVQGTPDEHDRAWINAPVVPVPAVLAENFDLGTIQFDGSVGGRINIEQREDFENFKKFYVAEIVNKRHTDEFGNVETVREEETAEEVTARLEKYARMQVSQTDHGQILRYGSDPTLDSSRPVEQVLSYDLTIGLGYAFGDADYWQYLLDLADWKVSDPFYKTGTMSAPGDYPEGLDTTIIAPPMNYSSYDKV
ncbi:MAG: DUF3274 domain-containing protein, partial [Gammaproteobacteria bacterium]|nr:DUF3274 domain-containing protein [Gammaproteobacteria bacterium]